MREKLEQRYESLFKNYSLERPIQSHSISAIIKNSLQKFLENSKNPAIYCNGGHTKIFMSDFMFELKKIKVIIDNYTERSDDSGFKLIRDDEIEKNGIDAIIISSFKFKNQIVDRLKKHHSLIPYLNIYDKIAENGIDLQSDYYYYNHPYHYYRTINSIQREVKNLVDVTQLENAYIALITKYIHIKDFRSAIIYTEELYKRTNKKQYIQLITDLKNLYEAEIYAAMQISERNILMLCLDGLRKQDLEEVYMPNLTRIFENSDYIFDNAYSFSTSTFESLIPVYSENGDLRTSYYEHNYVDEKNCRFIQEAKKQKRHIYFYTDMEHLIEGDDIEYSETFQTITEKLWSFILDAVEEKNGLYYIHESYESHFSFSNPYTEMKLISEGTAMLFDYLPQKGGRLRTDYEQQHLDALHYLDDIISPLIESMKCRMLIYADHGNLILKPDCKANDIKETKLTCDEEWIHIPYIIRSPEMGKGRCGRLISLMSFNDIMISLLEEKDYIIPKKNYIKVARSELYNPDFRCLYKQMGKERSLLAFEAFIFMDGYKLVIFSDGSMELFKIPQDNVEKDDELMKRLFKDIKEHITVCDLKKVGLDL